MTKSKKLIIIGVVVAMALLSCMLVGCMGNSIKVKFDTDGGSYVSDINVTDDMKTITLPEEPKKKGYTFSGWYYDEARTEAFDGSVVPKETVTVYAEWIADQITVTFRAKNPSTQYVTDIGVVVETGSSAMSQIPAVPEVEGYTGSWNLQDIDLSNVTAAFTVNAVYTKKLYKVTFDALDGSEPTVVENYMNYTFTMPATPSRDGYTFAGWYHDKAHTQIFNVPTVMPAADLNVYAWWVDTDELELNFLYETVDYRGGVANAIRITGLTRLATWKSELFVPRSIGGLPVVYLGDEYGTEENATFASSHLRTAVLPSTAEYIGAYAFAKTPNLSSVLFLSGNTMERVCEGAFKDCSLLTSIKLPSSVTTVEDYAFSGEGLDENTVMSLSSVDFGTDGKLTTLGKSVFAKCDNLKSLTLTSRYTNVNYESYNDSSIASVSVPATNTNVRSYGGVLYSANGQTLLFFPNLANEGGTYEIRNDTRIIADNAFRNNVSLISVSFPSSLVSIGAYAFYNFDKMTSIDLSACSLLQTIGDYAFYGAESATKALLPSGVTELGDYAFAECTELTAVNLPTTLTTVGEGVFYECGKIEALTIPSQLIAVAPYAFYNCEMAVITFASGNNVFDSVGDYAFYGCRSIISMELPSNMTTIGDYAFSIDDDSPVKMQLRSLEFLGNKLTTIGDGAFKYCTNLERMVLQHRGLSYVGEGAFYGCIALAAMSFNSSITALTKIQPYTFYGCRTLGNLTLPACVTELGDYAFYDCRNMSTLTSGTNSTEASITVIGNSTFENCIKLTANDGFTTQKLIFPRTQSIGERAFYGCAALAKIYVPNALLSIGKRAFGECTKLSAVTYDNTKVTELGKEVFYGCTSLVSFTVPKSITTISGNPFIGCNSMKFIYAEPNGNFADIRTQESSILYTPDLETIALFPVGLTGTYEIPESVTHLGVYSFSGARLSTVTVASGPAPLHIGIGAFASCKNLISVALNERVSEVGDYAFDDCRLLASLTIASTGEELTVGDYAFRNTSLNELTVPDRITSLGDYALYGSYKLAELTFAKTDDTLPLTIGKHCFSEASLLTALDFPARLTLIDDYAFAWCVGLSNISWGGGIEALTIGEHSFADCHGLRTLVLDERVSTLGERAFKNAENLIELTLVGVTAMGVHAFEGNARLVKVIVGEETTSIGDYAFYSDKQLSDIIFSDRTKSLVVGDAAFGYCTSLKSFILNRKIQSIGEYAFSYSGLKELIDDSDATETDEVVFLDGAFSNVGITSVSFVKRMKGFGKYSFAHNPDLTEVIFAADFATDLGERSFFDSGLTSLSLPVGIAIIGDEAFASNLLLTEVTFAENSVLSTVGAGAFRDCIRLAEISLPANVVTIGGNAFNSCLALSEVTIENNGDYTLGQFAFANCDRLEELDLKNVSMIEGTPFYGSDGLMRVYLNEENPYYTVTAYVIYSKNLEYDGVIYADSELLVAYPAGKQGSSYAIARATTRILDYAFSANQALTNIIVSGDDDGNGHAKVIQIGTNSLDGLSSDTEIYIQNNTINLRDSEIVSAYVHDSAWAEYSTKIKSTTETIGNFVVEMFSGDELSCKILRYIGLPESGTSLAIPSTLGGLRVSEIGEGAFQNNVILRHITLPVGLATIGSYAFSNCASLEAIDISDSVLEIGICAFEYCTSLTEVNFLGNSALAMISNYAFRGCTALREINIPRRVTEIGIFAFAGSEVAPMNLERIVFASNSMLSTIKNNAFQHCIKLNTVSLPASTESLGMHLFYGCTSLTSVILEQTSNVNTIVLENNRVFENTPKELTVYISRLVRQEYLKARYWKEIATRLSESESVYGDYSIEDTTETYTAVIFDSYIGIRDANTGRYDTTHKTEFDDHDMSMLLDLPYVELDAEQKTFTQLIENLKYTMPYASYATVSSTVLDVAIEHGGETFNHSVRVKTVTLTVSGIKLLKYIGTESNLVVPEKINGERVLSVGSYCINSKVVNLTLPHGVITIDDHAFSFASSMKSIELPWTLTEIGDHAFNGACIDTIGSGTGIGRNAEYSMLKSIGSYAFYKALNFGESTEFVIPPRVKEIGAYAFAGESKDNLANVSEFVFLGKSMDYVGNYAFSCTNVYHVKLPFELKRLGDYAFYNCKNLLTVSILEEGEGDSVNIVQLDSSAGHTFDGCTYLKIYTMDKQVARYRSDLYWRGQGLESRLLPISSLHEISWLDGDDEHKGHVALSVTSEVEKKAMLAQYYGDDGVVLSEEIGGYTLIAVSAYAFNNSTKKVSLPDTVTSINAYAFYNSAVNEVQFGTGLDSIGSYSFYGTKMTSITIPYNVTRIFDHAFFASDLEEVIFDERDRADSEEHALTIETYAFSQNMKLRNVYLPKRLTELGAYAFANNPVLTGFYMISQTLTTELELHVLNSAIIAADSNLKTIGEGALQGCSSLTDLYIPFSVESIGAAAFTMCDNLNYATVLRGKYGDEVSTGELKLTTAASGIFVSAGKPMFKIFVPRNSYEAYRTSDNWRNFAGYSTTDPDYIIENQVANDFAYSISANTVTLRKYLGNEEILEIPAMLNVGGVDYNIKAIGSYFANATLKEIIFKPGNVDQMISKYAFADARMLRSVTLPTTVKTVESYAFYNCSDLERIVLPTALTGIAGHLFDGCKSLVAVEIPSTVTAIGDYAFKDCQSLTRITIGYTADSKVVENGVRVFDAVPTTMHIFVDINLLSAYKGKTGWSVYAGKIYALTSIFGDYTIDRVTLDTCVILQYVGANEQVEIPAAIQGYKVTEIEEGAIGANVKQIILPLESEIIVPESLSDRIVYAEE